MSQKVLINGGFSKSLINFKGDLIRRFRARGYDVLACAAEADDQATVDKLAEWGVKYVATGVSRTGVNPLSDLRYLLKMRSIIKEYRPDIIVNYTHKPVIFGTLAAAGLGVVVNFSIITGLGYTFIDGVELKRRLSAAALRFLYKVSSFFRDGIVFLNNEDKALFHELKLVRAGTPTFMIKGSGVDAVNLLPSEPVVKPVRFMMCARLIYDKGVREYFQACEVLKSKYPEVEFQLLGPIDTAYPNAITPEELDGYKSRGIIHYLGETKSFVEAYQYMCACSVFVLPSYREGSPRTVAEAMCAAKPIITTTVPGCNQTVAEGVNGFLIQPKDVAGLVKAMEYFILSPDKIEPMGLASRQKVEAEFSNDIVNEQVIEIIEAIRQKKEKSHSRQ